MKKALLTFVFLAIILISSNVQAAGNVTLTANKTSVNVGDEFTISINLSGAEVASLTSRVTVDTSKVEYVSGPSNSNFRNGRIIFTWTDPNGGDSPLTGGTLATFKLRAKSAGNAGFSVNGDYYASDESAINLNFSGITVAIQEPVSEEPNNQEPIISNTITNQTDSSNQVLTNTQDTSENYNTNTTQNELNNQETSGKVINTSTSENLVSQVSNNTQVESDTNTNQTISQKTSNYKTNEELSSNAYLKSLRLDTSDITPSFSPNILQYETTINKSINNIDVLALPDDPKSSISITGNNNLQMGNNLIQVTVIAQNGDKKTYNVLVNKIETAEKMNGFLENLAIEDVMLIPDFKYNIFEYKGEVVSTKDKIKILAVPQIEGAVVNIQGQENLVFGENIILVTVTSEDGTVTNTYSIKIYRKTLEEELNEKTDNQLDDLDINEQTDIDVTNQNVNKTVSIIMAIIVCIGVIGIIIIIILKYKKENTKNKK